MLEKMKPFIVMEVLEKAQELERKGINIIHMEVGEPDFDVPACVKNAVNEAMQLGKTHYTHSLGDVDLRNEIKNLYKREYGVEFSENQIVVDAGSSPSILMVLRVLCSPGDEVIVFNPGYSCYSNFILAVNAVPKEIKLAPENGFKIDIEDVKKAITCKTKAIFINSPSNPFGTLIEPEIMQSIANLGITVISDEIYHGLVYEGKAHSILEYTKNAFVLNGFSKRFAMTGLRLGYLVAPEQYMRTLQIMQQNLFICAPSVSQYAGIAAIKYASEDVERMKKIYNERRIYLISVLEKIGFKIWTKPQGAFYVYADARKFTNDSYKFAFEILENAHVGVTPGTDFGSQGEGFLRFSYANSLENLQEGMRRLEEYLKIKP
ncbi:MAG: pyridoxal phosphate-dependent aminotransferase [Bacteroidales bacterium]|nr:pyridoxal phosphate-dependent aminotransferase [Bacteroidales bacterium]